jgi:outer membrane protein insertion porin family
LYTKEGVGRGYSLYFQTVDPSKLDIATFSSDKLGGEVNYNIPLTNTSSLQLGGGLEHLKITSLGGAPAAPLNNFVTDFGTRYDEVRATLGFTQNTYDQFPFPTKGYSQQLSVLLATPFADGVSYYKSSYVLKGYYPLIRGFILSGTGRIGYGNQFNGEGLPFFENFFAGGIAPMGMVRGFDTYSLGPKDENNNAIGGNYLVSGTLALILPYPLSRESVRTSAFVDVGNVYAKNTPSQYTGTDAGELRSSFGVAVDWRSPLGPLSFSLGWDINSEPGDQLSRFQFTVISAV